MQVLQMCHNFALTLPQSISRTADIYTTPQPMYLQKPKQNTYFLLMKDLKCTMKNQDFHSIQELKYN